MTRSILAGLLGLFSVGAIGLLPIACQSGGVGDPCTPEDEYDPQFAGFKVSEENIESRSFQCQTRICLVNHFQGRVSCPLGQLAPTLCQNLNDTSCPNGDKCVEASVSAPPCDPTKADKGRADCNGYGDSCNVAGKFCQCDGDTVCAVALGNGWFCDAKLHQCKSFVCHKPGACQVPGFDNDAKNKGKDCCIPGTDTPIAVDVCGQCRGPAGSKGVSTRSADSAVYCSCRCDVAEGEPKDPNFNFCTCPSGFSCEEIRKNVGLGDAQITGKYCIKDNTKFKSEDQCGNVNGFFNSQECKGIGN